MLICVTKLALQAEELVSIERLRGKKGKVIILIPVFKPVMCS